MYQEYSVYLFLVCIIKYGKSAAGPEVDSPNKSHLAADAAAFGAAASGLAWQCGLCSRHAAC